IAAAIWSQKDMGSPSGGKARHRGGTQVGKAPPSPEMGISGLTESGLSGRIRSPNLISPRLCRTLRPAPSGGLFRFWAPALQRLSRLSANHFAPPRIPHRGLSPVKRAGKMATGRAAQCGSKLALEPRE